MSRAAVATFALWNPFVVERLALGQWALLASYAAAWWLVVLLPAWLASGGRRAGAALVPPVALASVTPTGGLVALLLVASYAVTRRSPRAWAAVGVAAAFQLPWLLPSLWGHGSTTSDPRGVAAFAARAEHAGGVLATLLGTGGVWDRFVVPASRGSLLGVAAAALVVAALAVGLRRQPAGLVLAGGVGLVLAVLPVVPGTENALGWFVAHVPGGGLLRDSQKWLLPFVVLAGRCLGETVSVVSDAVSRRDRPTGWAVGAFAVVLPVVVMPDAVSTTAAALDPVSYPAGLAQSVAVLDGSGPGDVVVLPWQAYRLYDWGNPLSAADPLPRWTTRRVVADDRLATDVGQLRGEDARTAAVGALVGAGPTPGGLRGAGIGWVLVYRDQPGAAALPTSGLDLVVDSPEVRLYRVPGAPAASPADTAPSWLVALTAVVDLLLLTSVIVAAVVLLVGFGRRKPARPA